MSVVVLRQGEILERDKETGSETIIVFFMLEGGTDHVWCQEVDMEVRKGWVSVDSDL